MIKPWPKVRGLKDYEWKRDKDEDIQNPEKRRNVNAIFTKIEKDAPFWLPEAEPDMIDLPSATYDEAIFQEEDGIKEFYVARRLVKKFKIGDHVLLDVAGCCSVMGITLTRERR